MLSVSLLQRLVNSREYERLIQDIIANGMPLPLPMQVRLGHEAPALGLALRRLVELTYAPTRLSRSLVEQLFHRQAADGSFPGSADVDPLATAAAAAGFNAVLRDHPPTSQTTRIQAACDRALGALAHLQGGDGLYTSRDDRTIGDRAMSSALILTWLSGNERFAATSSLARLMTWFDENRHRLDAPTHQLYELARVSGPASVQPAPMLAGMAA